jgi:hypothetical protein
MANIAIGPSKRNFIIIIMPPLYATGRSIVAQTYPSANTPAPDKTIESIATGIYFISPIRSGCGR